MLKFRTSLLRKDTAPSILTGMSQNATYPPMEQIVPPPLLYQTKGCPKTGHPFAYYLEVHFTPHFYQNTSFSMLPVPSALLRWHIISGFQVRGIGRRNQ